MSNILFATSEVFPLIKTGGLADVAASLPRALTRIRQNVRVILPAYAPVMKVAAGIELKKLHSFDVDGKLVTLWKTKLPETRVTALLVDIPEFFEREGNPYCGPDGRDWPDNSQRFCWFAKVVRLVALNQAGLKWPVDIVHCNDWQTGLIPAFLSRDSLRPKTIFTIHNLAYCGVFPYQEFLDLNLPAEFWHHESLEFYNQVSFMKGGLVYADHITTVSPTYSQEIQTLERGHGLDGLLRHRQTHLSGILNGIDADEWNPATDQSLAKTYSSRSLDKKQLNKTALQEKLGLTVDSDVPLLGFIGRLVDQKGIELILTLLPLLITKGYQVAILGSGNRDYEESLMWLAQQHPEQLSVTIDYNETLAHQIKAGIDIFMMPSAYEPCGLNQLYSLRYGTIPVVHAVGGLRDSVADYKESEQDTAANGFVFYSFTSEALLKALQRAISCYQDKDLWRTLQKNGMSLDLSWLHSAQQYLNLYNSVLGMDERSGEIPNSESALV